jgi:hypothetical protein
MRIRSQHRYRLRGSSRDLAPGGHYSLTGIVSPLRRTRSDRALSLSIEAAAFNDVQVPREALVQMPLPCLRSSELVSRVGLSMPKVRLMGRQARDTLPMRAMRQLGWETRLELPVRAVRAIWLGIVLSR